MKKMLTMAIVAALASAAVAAAKKPPTPPKPVKGSVTQTTGYKNSAKLCKALMAANSTLFKTSFGTNHNKANAYGKCVSSHAQVKNRVVSITIRNITINATGTVTNAGAAGCQTTAAGCTLGAAGNLSGGLLGTFTSTFTVLWQQATSNGAGGYCAPATGTVVLTFPGLGTVTKTEKGNLCEVGATGVNVAHAFTGTIESVTGTGVFTGLTSSATPIGTATFTQQPGATSSMGGAVTGSETFSSLTLKL
jgi:hypothetical protein